MFELKRITAVGNKVRGGQSIGHLEQADFMPVILFFIHSCFKNIA